MARSQSPRTDPSTPTTAAEELVQFLDPAHIAEAVLLHVLGQGLVVTSTDDNGPRPLIAIGDAAGSHASAVQEALFAPVGADEQIRRDFGVNRVLVLLPIEADERGSTTT